MAPKIVHILAKPNRIFSVRPIVKQRPSSFIAFEDINHAKRFNFIVNQIEREYHDHHMQIDDINDNYIIHDIDINTFKHACINAKVGAILYNRECNYKHIETI